MTELRLNDRGVIEIWSDKRGLDGIMQKIGGGSWEFEIALKRALKIESSVYYYGTRYTK